MGSEISVASVVYNLAGDVKDRPNYLKSLVVRSVLADSKKGVGQSIYDGYTNGPAMQLRSFYRWAKNESHYGQVGMPTGDLEVQGTLEPSLVAPHIPPVTGMTIFPKLAYVRRAEPQFWAERWLMENRPADIGTDWVAEYTEATHQIKITFPDTTTQTIPAGDFNYISRFVYAYYDLLPVGTGNGESRLYIYRIGSGNPELDALSTTAREYGDFFPFIPIRLNNKFLSSTYLTNAYPQVKKGLKKSIGADFDDLIEQISDNVKLSDIDHAYVAFGVSLNTIEPACKKYVYKFFERLQAQQAGDPASYATWLLGAEQAEEAMLAWVAWKQNPVGPEPARPTFSETKGNVIRISGTGEINSRFDVRLSWRYIQNGVGTGLGKPGAKVGEIWVQHTGTDNVYQTITYGRDHNTRRQKVDEIHHMRISWQRAPNVYTYLDVVGCKYNNYIYKGHAVNINTKQAIRDGDESGFILPLHYDTWKEMSLVDATQMSTACCFVIFNCYEKVKTKWYQTGIFKIFLVIAIAILSVVFTGGAGIGILGANLSIGAAMGFSGLTAAIVGSVVNALAALVLSTVLEKMLGGLGALGTIISAVIMIVVGNVASAFNSTESMALNWGQLLRVDNLLKLTDALGRGVSTMLQNETLEIQQAFLDYAEKTKREVQKIQQAYFEEFGYGGGVIDPFMFVDSTSGPINESSSTFLTRTLMTGSEIAEMSRELLYEFPSLSLKLPDAFT